MIRRLAALLALCTSCAASSADESGSTAGSRCVGATGCASDEPNETNGGNSGGKSDLPSAGAGGSGGAGSPPPTGFGGGAGASAGTGAGASAGSSSAGASSAGASGLGGGPTGGSNMGPDPACQACASELCDGNCPCVTQKCGPECGKSLSCPELALDAAERCTNDADDNADGKTDCDDAACSASCKDMCEVPPPLGESSQGSLVGHTDTFAVKCAPSAKVGPSIAYRYVAPSAGRLSVELTSSNDLILSAHRGGCKKPEGGLILCRNEVGAGGTEKVEINASKDDVIFVMVTAPSPSDGSAKYKITHSFEAAACGDGKVSPDEQCDDGNTDGGDGCSADCSEIEACTGATAIADVFLVGDVIQVPTSLAGNLSGAKDQLGLSCAKPGATTPEAIYSFRAALDGRLEAQVVPSNPADDLVLAVRTSCNKTAGELHCLDSSKAGGERLSIEAKAGAQYFLVVESYGGAPAGAFTIAAQSLPDSCGDGYLTPTTEQCDPNNENEKNCLPSCTRPVPSGEALAGAGVSQLGGSPLTGQISPAEDVDSYTFTVAPGEAPRKLSILPLSSASDDCLQNRIDSQLELLDEQGNLLAFNDDDGASRCSALLIEQPGKYIARVRASKAYAPRQVFTYRIALGAP